MGSKRTKVKATIILGREDRKFIESTGRSLQSFFTELLATYKQLNMNKWRNGVVVHHGCRMLLFDSQGLSYIIEQSKDPYGTGRTVARQMKGKNQALDTTLSDRNALKKWVEEHSKLYGWGAIEYSHDRLIVEYPAIANEEFVRGYFEELLSVSFSCRLANKDIQIFLTKHSQESARSE